MNLREIHNLSVERLEPLYGRDEARSVVDRLMEDKYGVGRLERVTDGHRPFLREAEWQADLQRLETWEPIQYVIERQKFSK